MKSRGKGTSKGKTETEHNHEDYKVGQICPAKEKRGQYTVNTAIGLFYFSSRFFDYSKEFTTLKPRAKAAPFTNKINAEFSTMA